MQARPQTKLFGITHGDDGQLAVKASRALKVSIGRPGGKDAHVFVDASGDIVVKSGEKTFKTKDVAAAKAAYARALVSAPSKPYPAKLPYFTFTNPTADGTHHANIDAIVAHGPLPTEIDVVLFGPELGDFYKAQMAMWGKTELQCSGDGQTAQRLVTLARTPEEKARVKPGERFFTVDVCFMGGCPYSKGTISNGKEKPPACKPQMNLTFQLAKFPVRGGSAGYATTSYKTIKSIGASAEEAAAEMAAGVGLSATLRLLPYDVKGTKAWYVSMWAAGSEIVIDSIEAPEVVELPEAAQAAQFNSEFRDEDAQPEEMPVVEEAERKPLFERMPAPMQERVREIAKEKKLNKAKMDTFLAKPEFEGQPFATVIEALLAL